MSEKKYILSKEIAEKKIRRIALEVTERNYTEQELILIGIKENGIVIANKIASYLKETFKGKIEVLDLSLDKKNPTKITLSKPIDFNNKAVLLVDDVVNGGKTLLYALKPLLEYHPEKIQTIVLVARTHKAFPVAVDYVGLSFSTTLDEHIFVEVEKGEITGAYIQ
ncbi:phosphoribosyltransferase family protein [Ferruginibacter albus]|uniref:phosphoribosyltransferase family protein n=1 Tax=Ferruginibacter albus TaxID=2875540 RepID=UPI001CC7F2B2|nr:phosphoribosyltransferase family protein [Ferruginibacter albus]UAY53412.1 phosphoribosyltransferase [Ferruginibacter albus]